MARRRTAVLVALGAAALLAGIASASSPGEVHLRAGRPIDGALDDIPAGATVVLGAGTHRGPIVIDRAITLRGEAGAVVRAPDPDGSAVTVSADGARVMDVAVIGGSSGITVRESNGVTIEDVTVRGADLHGIEVVDASAHVSGVVVDELQSRYAQGIEIRNSNGRSESIVADSSVSGGQEGIVSHVSAVRFQDNEVRGTTMRAIAVTEMSDGVVTGNRVSGAAGAGLFCGDMSRCEFSNNRVAEVVASGSANSTAGWGLAVTFHATASSDGDVLAGEAGERAAFVGSRIVAQSPLQPGDGWDTLIPAALAALVTLLLLVAVAPVAARLRGKLFGGTGGVGMARWERTLVAAVLVAGTLVQTFHMIEHTLQVVRVHGQGVPSRGGLVGPAVEAEWVHFTYNTVILLLLVIVAVARRNDWRPRGATGTGDNLLLVALALQTYHVVEHTAKLIQHLATGANVNPGFLGTAVDLVWLHFTLNLAVYAAMLIATVAYLGTRRPLRQRSGVFSEAY